MATTRCYRHTRWIAACTDCTAWYLARLPHRATAAAAQHTGPAAAAWQSHRPLDRPGPARARKSDPGDTDDLAASHPR
jgi:hypothetical protein